MHMASLTAGLVVSKSAYGDNLVLTRRLRDMDLAAEMRWSMLPPLTFTNDRVAIAGMLEPAYEIAGDAFDYAVNGDVAHVAIIDAMGHGLEASRMANLAVGSYRHSRRRGLDLVATFAAMDKVVAEQFGAEKFVTGQLVSLDLANGRLTWVNAGHPRPLLWRDGAAGRRPPLRDVAAPRAWATCRPRWPRSRCSRATPCSSSPTASSRPVRPTGSSSAAPAWPGCGRRSPPTASCRRKSCAGCATASSTTSRVGSRTTPPCSWWSGPAP